MQTFPFKNRRVELTFPDRYRLTYERNGYIEAHPSDDSPIILRFSLHPSNDMRRPPEFGKLLVSHEAAAAGQPLTQIGSTVLFFAGSDDQFAQDDVILRRWKAGFQSWVVAVSATIAKSRESDSRVRAVEEEIPPILASLAELPKPPLLRRLLYRLKDAGAV